MTVRVERLIIFGVIRRSYVKQMCFQTLRFESNASDIRRTLLILITRIQWLKVHARAFRRPIEETRTMSENTSLAVEKYKTVLCATGGTRNYV